MLHMHKKLKKYMQFGGHVELHETPWQTIIHEIKEEAGYNISQLSLLQPANSLAKVSNSVIHPYPLALATFKYGDLDHYHTDTAFAFVTKEAPHHKIEDDESKDIRLFTKRELLNAKNDLVPENVKEVALYVLDHILKNWQKTDANDFAS
ncbi:MAG: putative pyrophosphohydrolase including oxidative damage repair enzyme [Candidatus Saccharibacteria bacterium]|nr:putative pyrophosphohydrolase including oxidative damage repair enzyme [Candidatus Saccharibacteria bacterium]